MAAITKRKHTQKATAPAPTGALVLSDRDFKKVRRLAHHPRKPAQAALRAMAAFRMQCPENYARFRDEAAGK